MTRSHFLLLFALAGTASVWRPLPPLAATGQRVERTIWSGVFTVAQAKRGELVYKQSCTYCHKDDLSGGFLDDGVGRAPALAGRRAFDSSLFERWANGTVRDLAATTAATMPQENPTSLSIQAYVDVVSYLLSRNGLPAGDTELPVDVEALGQILITPKK